MNDAKVQNKPQSFEPLIQNLINLGRLFSQVFIEIYYGIKKDTIPYLPILFWGLLFNLIVITGMDLAILSYYKVAWLYPRNIYLYAFYVAFFALLGFFIWGLYQTGMRKRLLDRLTEVFKESGLSSPMGKLPSFIFDLPIDEIVRRLRVTNAHMPLEKFKEATSRLESSLNVFIDEISEDKSNGTIDIIYSHYEIKKMVELSSLAASPNSFLVGQTRARTIVSDLNAVPHLLIGGQTGGGKSTFMRQLITTLYLNNKNYEFTLIDLKGGLEFQIFENKKRVNVISNPKDVLEKFRKMEELLSERFEILKMNQCRDIDGFYKIPDENLKLPNGLKREAISLKRQIIVVDEAAEVFLSGGPISVADSQSITRSAVRLSSLGRAAGIHLILATQKPDAQAISTKIKINLVGMLSFQMPTLGASMSILGNARAKELPAIPGRAIWKHGMDQVEVQTPYISAESVLKQLEKSKDEDK